MSTRWMVVQYIGDILRIPVANESDMDTPFGSSTLERDVRRIVVNPFSDSPQMFVPEAENAKLRELVRDLYEMAYPEYPSAFAAAFADRMRELGVEVDA